MPKKLLKISSFFICYFIKSEKKTNMYFNFSVANYWL